MSTQNIPNQLFIFIHVIASQFIHHKYVCNINQGITQQHSISGDGYTYITLSHLLSPAAPRRTDLYEGLQQGRHLAGRQQGAAHLGHLLQQNLQQVQLQAERQRGRVLPAGERPLTERRQAGEADAVTAGSPVSRQQEGERLTQHSPHQLEGSGDKMSAADMDSGSAVT